jgi:hypothetical protein
MSNSSIPPEDRPTMNPDLVIPKAPPVPRKPSVPSFTRAKATLINARTQMPTIMSISRMQEATQALRAHNNERRRTNEALEKNRKKEEERLGVPLKGVEGLKDPGKGPPPGLFSKMFKQPDPVPNEEKEETDGK